MLPSKELVYVDSIPSQLPYIVVGDIGGTNSNFGFFCHSDGRLQLVLSIHVKSKEITDFPLIVSDMLTYVAKKYGITVVRSGFAAAGVVSENLDYSSPTNTSFVIDARAIERVTKVPCAFVVNDFQVIGYGLDQIQARDVVPIGQRASRPHATMAIIGAGTGLGKCIMYWDKRVNRHVSIASEGGHADFAAQDQLELDLVDYIKSITHRASAVSWEDVLSGDGIQRLYHFFVMRNSAVVPSFALKEHGPHPDEIFNQRNEDEHCWHTFELYTKLYARCAKNFALDALAIGGLFIAGGIAANNLELFKLDAFMNEFVNCGKQRTLLEQIPLFVITDYNVSLYGAAQFMVLEGFWTP